MKYYRNYNKSEQDSIGILYITRKYGEGYIQTDTERIEINDPEKLNRALNGDTVNIRKFDGTYEIINILKRNKFKMI